MHVRMCDVHKTEQAVHGPFSARLWSVQYPFESRLTSVLLKWSGVKQTVHGSFFGHILSIYIYICAIHLSLRGPIWPREGSLKQAMHKRQTGQLMFNGQ